MTLVSRLTVVIALLAALSAAPAIARLPGDGADDRCDGIRPSKFEQRLNGAKAFRQQFGFRSDRKYLVRVLRARRYRRSIREYGQPLTPAELLYLRNRRVVEQKADLVQRYVDSQPRSDFVSLAIEDDYPRGAYVAVRFTGNLERHTQGLSSIGVRTQVLLARFSSTQLEAAMGRVWPARHQLMAEGIKPAAWHIDDVRNTVILNVISARPDASEVVQRLLGPEVQTEVIATTPYRQVCTSAEAYTLSKSGRTLRITWATNAAFELIRVDHREGTRSVRITISERAANGPVTAVAAIRSAIVRLKAPLGARVVLDAESGRRLREGKRP